MALEPKIGEVFELDGEKYKCVKGKGCHKCILDFLSHDCVSVSCGLDRKDETFVVFKLITDEPNKSNSNQ